VRGTAYVERGAASARALDRAQTSKGVAHSIIAEIVASVQGERGDRASVSMPPPRLE
jgi:hypothetical protein